MAGPVPSPPPCAWMCVAHGVVVMSGDCPRCEDCRGARANDAQKPKIGDEASESAPKHFHWWLPDGHCATCDEARPDPSQIPQPCTADCALDHFHWTALVEEPS